MSEVIKSAFFEPWTARVSESWPYVYRASETTLGEVDATRSREHANWLLWGTGHPARILAFTQPKGDDVKVHPRIAGRIAACVNACAGMKDPMKGMEQARDALAELLRCESLEDFQELQHKALSALSRIIPAMEHSHGNGG